MSELAPRISIPGSAQPGEIIEIKTLISHPMHTGFARDTHGELIPVHIIETFVCEYRGKVVFRADLQPGTAANPYLTFHLRAAETGPLVFRWCDDRGDVVEVTRTLNVAAS